MVFYCVVGRMIVFVGSNALGDMFLCLWGDSRQSVVGVVCLGKWGLQSCLRRLNPWCILLKSWCFLVCGLGLTGMVRN